MATPYTFQALSSSIFFGSLEFIATVDQKLLCLAAPAFMGTGFVGVIEHPDESLFDLLDVGSTRDSSSELASYAGSCGTPRGCNMVQLASTLAKGGAGTSAAGAIANPGTSAPTNSTTSMTTGGTTETVPITKAGEAQTMPHPGDLQQRLRERWAELEETRRQLQHEKEEIDRELACPDVAGRSLIMARNVHQCIVTDDQGPPQFTRARQNIAAAIALLSTFPEPTTPEAQQVQREVAALLTKAAQLQVVSLQRRSAQSNQQISTSRRAGGSNAAGSQQHSIQKPTLAGGTPKKAKVHDRVGPYHDARHTLKVHRHEKERLNQERGYQPHRGGRYYDIDEERSQSSSPPGPWVFSLSESVVSSHDVSQSGTPVAESVRSLDNDESQQGSETGAFTGSQDPAQTMFENDNFQEVDTDRPEAHSNVFLDGTTEMQDSVAQDVNIQQDDTEHNSRFWQPSLEDRLDRWPNQIEEDAERNWEDNAEDLHSEPLEDDGGEHGHLQEEHDEWHDDESHGTVENWQDDYQDSRLDAGPIPRTENRFIPPDDDNVYSMELRELLSRRSVSNLLTNGFGESLEQLIRSYVQRRGHGPLNWNLDTAMPNSVNENQEQERITQTRQFQGPVKDLPLLSLTHLCHRDSHYGTEICVITTGAVDTVISLKKRKGVVLLTHETWDKWDAINDLRADMGRLQQGMSSMQRMLEACMDMQLELQRSVRQEVSAALNRFAGPEGQNPAFISQMWAHVYLLEMCK
ncbi:hypothetical protein PR202_gb17061 [Eleusine coracana subsp. coracana]|uniref:Uncharacterized protein n=1 Tax=Eleusine coracana subsp. coracana TaxID=191504 RepID=A0AAV5EZQ0_ELECO|nr:hypothetical protein PR202_gb17061 [Eleusine coracana subsp. coracana]